MHYGHPLIKQLLYGHCYFLSNYLKMDQGEEQKGLDSVEFFRKEARERNKSDLSLPVKGVVTARKCKYCQHHEIGIKSKTGYLPLKPGMKIELLEE
jgi:hypothetical protein